MSALPTYPSLIVSPAVRPALLLPATMTTHRTVNNIRLDAMRSRVRPLRHQDRLARLSIHIAHPCRWHSRNRWNVSGNRARCALWQGQLCNGPRGRPVVGERLLEARQRALALHDGHAVVVCVARVVRRGVVMVHGCHRRLGVSVGFMDGDGDGDSRASVSAAAASVVVAYTGVGRVLYDLLFPL